MPKRYVGATVSERKQCKKIGGLAGRKKRRVLKERREDEKVIHSKALFLAETPPPAAEAGPSPRDKAAPFFVPEAVLPTDEDEDDDFQVAFCFGLRYHCTDSSCGWYRISEPEQASMGRGSSKLKLRPPRPWRPRRVSLPPELHQDRCLQPDGRLRSRCRAAQRRNRYVYNCLAKLDENDLLSPPPAQETEHTEGRRTSGRSSGAGRRKD